MDASRGRRGVGFGTASFAALTRFTAILEALPVGSELESASFEASKDAWFGTFKVIFIKAKS